MIITNFSTQHLLYIRPEDRISLCVNTGKSEARGYGSNEGEFPPSWWSAAGDNTEGDRKQHPLEAHRGRGRLTVMSGRAN